MITFHPERSIILSVAGEIDMATVGPLEASLDQVVSGSFESVTLDLSGVTFLDSAGINALVRARQRLAESSRTLGIRNPTRMVRRVLGIMGLDAWVLDAEPPDRDHHGRWDVARREFLADERDRLADERERLADERETDADARERVAPDRSGEGSHDSTLAASRARQAAAQARAAARTAREQGRLDRQAAPTILAQAFASIAGQLFAARSPEDVLGRISLVATELIPGCTACSVTIIERAGPVTAATAGPGALESDHAQYRMGEGPCLEAVREPFVYTAEVATDPRWPRLGQHYHSPLQTVASFGLYEAWSDPATAAIPASLNVYGTGIDALEEGSKELGLLLAAHASMALLVLDERAALQQLSAELTVALRSRDVIGQAKGILMERSKLTADDAFDVLRRTSQTYNRKLRDIAERLTLTGELPADPLDATPVGPGP